MPAVENQVGVVARPVISPELQEAAQLGLHGLQRDAAGGVVAAERLDHVVGEEALHVVQHPRRAQVQLLDLLRGQEVSSRYDQGVADAGSPQAAAELVEQAVGERLQRQHHEQSAEEEAETAPSVSVDRILKNTSRSEMRQKCRMPLEAMTWLRLRLLDR
ncbi:hypothetical protein EYF80_002881 [Liparis tanakae]|uniref:Uncharacterized protein n=1 Tax=Liparis tanakae TaxID=230148 RepID=A0A4Z2JAK0_9TELE|nr:hypothetical protein EYF80_002881 [Liparis tanakae]